MPSAYGSESKFTSGRGVPSLTASTTTQRWGRGRGCDRTGETTGWEGPPSTPQEKARVSRGPQEMAGQAWACDLGRAGLHGGGRALLCTLLHPGPESTAGRPGSGRWCASRPPTPVTGHRRGPETGGGPAGGASVPGAPCDRGRGGRWRGCAGCVGAVLPAVRCRVNTGVPGGKGGHVCPLTPGHLCPPPGHPAPPLFILPHAVLILSKRGPGGLTVSPDHTCLPTLWPRCARPAPRPGCAPSEDPTALPTTLVLGGAGGGGAGGGMEREEGTGGRGVGWGGMSCTRLGTCHIRACAAGCARR